MPFTTVTAVGLWTLLDNETAAAGEVTFQLTAPLTMAGEATIPTTPKTVALDDSGSISVDLVAVDDVDAMPEGVTYLVKEAIRAPGGAIVARRSWHFAPSRVNGTIDLRAVAPAQPSTPRFPFALQSALNLETAERIDGDAATLAAAATDATTKANAAQAAAATDATTKAGAAQAAATTAASDHADTGDDLVRQQLLDRIDGAGGQPVLSYAEVAYLDDGDLYLGPKMLPGDDVEVRVGYDGELIVVTPTTLDLETPTGAQSKADVAQAAAEAHADAGDVAVLAAARTYADSVAQGLSPKQAVKAATTIPQVVLSGLAVVDGFQTVDGDRILIMSQTTSSTNGLWVVHSGAWTRPADFAVGADVAGAYVFADGGSSNGGAGFVLAAPGPVRVGTDAEPWVQFTGAGEISAGAGLTKTGNQLAADFGAASGKVTEGSDPRLSDARTPLAHGHGESDVTGLAADLASKAASVHTHTEADITDLTMDPVTAALIFGGF